MKKSTIGILSFFVLMAVITSCKKDYSCRCTFNTMGVSVDSTIALGNMTKRDAKKECNNYESTYQNLAALATAFGVSVTVDCGVE